MLNLITNYKIYIIIMLLVTPLITYALIQRTAASQAHEKVIALQQEVASCKATRELMESAIEQYKLRSEEAAQDAYNKQKTIDSYQSTANERIRAIMHKTYSSDCNQAIAEGIADIFPQFNWSGNFPERQLPA